MSNSKCITEKLDELSLSIWNVKYSIRKAFVDKKDVDSNEEVKKSIKLLKKSMDEIYSIIGSDIA